MISEFPSSTFTCRLAGTLVTNNPAAGMLLEGERWGVREGWREGGCTLEVGVSAVG